MLIKKSSVPECMMVKYDHPVLTVFYMYSIDKFLIKNLFLLLLKSSYI